MSSEPVFNVVKTFKKHKFMVSFISRTEFFIVLPFRKELHVVYYTTDSKIRNGDYLIIHIHNSTFLNQETLIKTILSKMFKDLRFKGSEDFLKSSQDIYRPIRSENYHGLRYFTTYKLQHPPLNLIKRRLDLISDFYYLSHHSVNIIHNLPDIRDEPHEYKSEMHLGISDYKDCVVLCVTGRYGLVYDSRDGGFCLTNTTDHGKLTKIWKNVYSICLSYKWSESIARYPKFIHNLEDSYKNENDDEVSDWDRRSS